MTAGPGTVLGHRYQLVKPLAAGGMGTVWLAQHIELETEVAIKLIDGPLGRRPDLIERFRREARAAAQLKTPNVVQILDYGVDAGTPYIAMELLDGEDLDALLDREKTLSPRRVADILRPLCRALGLAHGAGIVHRDLKPANVFLARVAGEEVVKLVDFGIAKELHRGAEWTTGASMVGSPLFMSPEQIGGSASVDARTDVWSLAVMAYLMLFGEPPFYANGVAAILYRIAHDTYEVPSARSPGLAPFDAFFRKALARPLAERYASVADLMTGFDAAVGALADPSLAVDPTKSQVARSGTVAMSPSQAPPPEAFDEPATAISGASGRASLLSLPGHADDDAATRAVPSDVRADAPLPSVSIPPAPRVAPSRAPEPTSFPWPWLLGGVVLGLGAISVYVAQSGDAPPAASSAVVSAEPATAHRGGPSKGQRPPPRTEEPTVSSIGSASPSAAASPSVTPPPDAAGTAPPPLPPEPSAKAPSAPAPSGQPSAAKPGASSAPRAPAKPAPGNVDPEWGVPVH